MFAPSSPKPRRDHAEHAGPVRNGQAERDDAALALQLAHHDRGENARIDVAAAQNRARPCGRRSARDVPAAPRARPRPRLPPWSSAGSGTRSRRAPDAPPRPAAPPTTSSRTTGAVSVPTFFTAMPSASVAPPTARLLAVQRVPHRRIERALDADDLDRGFDRPRGDRIAGDQSAAADRDHQHVEVGRLLQHFERDGALPGDHVRIVIGMHPDQRALARRSPRRAPARRPPSRRAAPPSAP